MLQEPTADKNSYNFKPPLTSQPSLPPDTNYTMENNSNTPGEINKDDIHKLPRHFATPNHHRTQSSGHQGNLTGDSTSYRLNPRPQHAGYFTPQPNRKSYLEQLNQAKAESLRLAILSDEEVGRNMNKSTCQSGANKDQAAALQRRFSTNSANVEVNYLLSEDGVNGGQIGFFGGMFSCLKPVWALVGGKGPRETGSYSTES